MVATACHILEFEVVEELSICSTGMNPDIDLLSFIDLFNATSRHWCENHVGTIKLLVFSPKVERHPFV